MTAAKFLSALALAALTACADTEPQYLLEPAPSKLRVNSVVRTVLVRTVSLPTYAADQKIAVQGEGGEVLASDFGLWADEPERATTLIISRNLNTMTSARVAPEPWPLPEPPKGVIDIRIETFIATQTDTFRMSGQYFMGSETPDPIENFDDPDAPPKIVPAPLSDKARVFDIIVALPVKTAAAIAAAQATALTTLSEQIARDMASR
ncbi:ABC-type transport auxiliary lipoprotein family protein [Marinovum sp. SP66]|uniref:ABC-type transport auxiliary lipoprotein family protein n=1 Tax=Marinovum TaxID=367771 RepID=UPI00237AD4C8|nr:ABC-type transport auxiliary lipoprotein family protein [Marinovum sp. SP66]MDD9742208.1 ABC-type transport auxiliary lipoprotein family protein [Marinovum sp. SP66]